MMSSSRSFVHNRHLLSIATLKGVKGKANGDRSVSTDLHLGRTAFRQSISVIRSNNSKRNFKSAFGTSVLRSSREWNTRSKRCRYGPNSEMIFRFQPFDRMTEILGWNAVRPNRQSVETHITKQTHNVRIEKLINKFFYFF